MAEELEAGRALDALIAERVMGLAFANDAKTFVEIPGTAEEIAGGHLVQCAFLPPYSTDIAAAWTVVERVDNRNSVAKQIGVQTFGLARCDDGTYAAMFFNASARADSAPLAICRAALLATPPREAPLENTHVASTTTEEQTP